MDKDYDLLVLGTGVAGTIVASKCRSAGLSVAIVDTREYGGTCSLRGCNPKKVLVAAAQVIHRYKHIKGKGVKGDITIDWGDLIQFKRTFTESMPEKTEEMFANAGIEMYKGSPQFVGKNRLNVQDQTLNARVIVIATGAKPRPLAIPGKEFITTSEGFMEMTSLPEQILFIGGGYVSFEFSHVAADAGANVTILEALSRPLANFDPDLVDLLVQASREKQIDIRMNIPVNAIEKSDGKLRVLAGEQNEHVFEADIVVHGAGRIPNLDGLDLEKAEIELEDNKILVNEYLQSVSNPAIYIAGDANAQSIPLTPVADEEGRVVARNILKGNQVRPNYDAVPSVVFTSPRLASVGLREKEAEEHGLKYTVNFEETSSWTSTRRLGLRYSGYKVLLDQGTGHILGAHLLGHAMEEVINLFALAMKAHVHPDTIKRTLLVFPTVAHDIKSMLSQK